MTIPLTEVQYGTLLRTLTVIANGRDANHRRLSREEVTNIAREACDVMGWRYDTPQIEAMERNE